MVFEKTLTAMVKGIRANRGKEDEYIQGCLKEIRKELNSTSVQTKSIAVLKLCYLTILGYDMSWAGFVVTEVMANAKYPIKRPGYLAASMTFDESTEVALLTTNLFKKDFGAPSQVDTGLALSCLSNIVTESIAVDLVNDLLSLLASSRPYIRKKTALCLFKVFVRYPTALRICYPKLKDRLGDEDQGVLTAVCNTFLELSRKNPKNYLGLVPQFFHILTNTQNNWLCIKLLKLFAILCPLEPRLLAKLVEPMTTILDTTKAKSVEFEAIRFVVEIMPTKTSLFSNALQKLRGFMNSGDRNLRYLAFVLLAEVLEKHDKEEIMKSFPELQERVTESVEEVDSTVRGAALRLMNLIVTPGSFPEVVEKLRQFLKSGHGSDQFLAALLRMGQRDQYSLVEDFGWYLLILADLAKYKHSIHASEVANQILDVTLRVPQVRPFALSAARVLLKEIENVAPDALAAIAWILGEYHPLFEESKDCPYRTSVETLISPYVTTEVSSQVQVQCIWAATKLYIGAAHHAPDALPEIVKMLMGALPRFLNSIYVDVSERSTMTHYLISYFDCDAGRLKGMAAMLEEALLPVPQGAQALIECDASLEIDTPFYKEKQAEVFDDASALKKHRDDFQLVTDYSEDLNFCTLGDTMESIPQVPSSGPRTDSIFYLKDTKKADANKEEPKNELEAMMKSRIQKGQQYNIIRTEAPASSSTAPKLQQPTPVVSPASAAAASAATAAAAEKLNKEVSDLQNKRWFLLLENEQIRLYGCFKGIKKDSLRIDVRCDGQGLGDVVLSVENVPDLVVCEGPLPEKAPKAKIQYPVTRLLARKKTVPISVSYTFGEEKEKKIITGTLAIPAVTGIAPLIAPEEEIRNIISAGHMTCQASTVQTYSLESAGKLSHALTLCGPLCHFSATQQRAGPTLKSLFCGKLRSDNTPIVSMIQGGVKDDNFVVKVTVKSVTQEVCDEVKDEIFEMSTELLTGRLSEFVTTKATI